MQFLDNIFEIVYIQWRNLYIFNLLAQSNE